MAQNEAIYPYVLDDHVYKRSRVLQHHFTSQQQACLLCTCKVGSAARSTVLSSTGGKCLKDNIVNVFGSRLAEGLVALHAETASGTKLAG